MVDLSYPEKITPEAVLELDRPTDRFLCPLSATTYSVDFLEFEVVDDETNSVIFKVARDPSTSVPAESIGDLDPEVEASIRTIRYSFPRELLQSQSIRTSLVFSVGDKPVENFRMIERHYHDALIRSYDFDFGFCMPMSKNSWEALYPLPVLEDEQIQSMVDNPYSNRSDRFYFAGSPPRLIMHNKAEYEWTDE